MLKGSYITLNKQRKVINTSPSIIVPSSVNAPHRLSLSLSDKATLKTSARRDNPTLIASISLVALTFIFGLHLSNSFVSASDSVVDRINITVPVSCTMTGTGANTHNANINNGIYTSDIGTTTLHAYCNDNNGFAIYAAGYTGNEVGSANSNKLVGTSASGNTTIDTGLAISAGNPDISNWAMKLTKTQDSGDTSGTNAFTIDSAPNTSGGSAVSFTEYHTVPNEYTKVAHKDSATDMASMTGGAKLTTTYAAYISKTQPADTYSGQVIYTLVHPASAEAPIACKPSGTTIGTNTSTDIKCMQDITASNKSSILASMTEDQQYTLVDKRDYKTYTVSKLRDGNIWMTQNLDLDLDSSKTYTNLDTDLGYNTSTGQYETASWTPERSTYTSNTAPWMLENEATGEMEGNYRPESYDPGDLYWNGELWPDNQAGCEAASGTWDVEHDECYGANLTTSTGSPHYHLGNYYNWNAAIATNDGSGYGVFDEETGSLLNTEPNQSICPAGWTLPIGGDFNYPPN